MNNDHSLAGRIHYAMEQRDMTQADLARATGMSTSKISYIVSGKTKDPQFQAVVDIAKALDVPLAYLAGQVTYAFVKFGDDQQKG